MGAVKYFSYLSGEGACITLDDGSISKSTVEQSGRKEASTNVLQIASQCAFLIMARAISYRPASPPPRHSSNTSRALRPYYSPRHVPSSPEPTQNIRPSLELLHQRRKHL